MYVALTVVVIVVGLVAIGWAYKNNPKVQLLLDHSETNFLAALTAFAPLLLAFVPFVLDYAEALNIAPFAERVLHQREAEARFMIALLAWVGSLAGVLAVWQMKNIWDLKEKITTHPTTKVQTLELKNHFSIGAIVIIALCILVIWRVQVWILQTGWAVHVLPHTEEGGLELKFGLARYKTQEIYIGVNVAISALAGIWSFWQDVRNENAKKIAAFKKNQNNPAGAQQPNAPGVPPTPPPPGQTPPNGFVPLLPLMKKCFNITDFQAFISNKIGVDLEKIKNNGGVWTDAAKIDGPNTPAAIKSAQGNARLTLALDELRRLETVLLDSKEGLRTLAGSDSAMVTKKADIDRFKVELDKVERDSTMSANDKINAKDALTRNITAAEGEYNNMKTAKETLKMAILNDLQKEGYNTALLQGYSEY